jgi:hypothetical protein
MRTNGSKSMDEGATQLADARVMTEEVHHRESEGITIWLLRSRHSYHPHAHPAAQLRVTA